MLLVPDPGQAIDLSRGQSWDQTALAGSAVLAALASLLTWRLGPVKSFGCTVRPLDPGWPEALAFGVSGYLRARAAPKAAKRPISSTGAGHGAGIGLAGGSATAGWAADPLAAAGKGAGCCGRDGHSRSTASSIAAKATAIASANTP